MKLQVHETLKNIPADDWNRLNETNNPFLCYQFLRALEETSCIGKHSGWLPQYLTLESENTLTGIAPLFLKSHSYGEYIFDWAWANAYEQAGLQYYPKLIAAVPFTPVTGPRLLVKSDKNACLARQALIQGALQHAQALKVSSLHWLFIPESQLTELIQQQHMQRVGYQFHWHNQNYRDFDEFLASFSAHKRKKVKRERRYVQEAGIHMQVVEGKDITPWMWNQFYEFHHATIRYRGATPYLNAGFFRALGRTMPESVVLIMANQGGETVAAALNLRNERTLFGRYWGCRDNFHSLHFETCYYRAIDYCIEQGLQTFEAGAQGEHKLSRGFLPTPIYSAHWLSHVGFSSAVADFLKREKNGIEFYMDELNEHSPFKQTGD